MTTSTCQICGRAIKSAKGVIAHHGYSRPHQGYQTRSCEGAQAQPYEVSSNRIQYAIERRAAFIEDCKVRQAELIANPPASLTYENTFSGKRTEVERPADFDAQSALAFYGFSSRSYGGLWRRQHTDLRNRMFHTGQDIEYLRARLANWKAAA